MIKDTSGQDAILTAPPGQLRKRRILIAAIVLAVLAGSAYLVRSWSGSAHSVNMARLRIAQVSKGNLVRDASVNGRVVAAVSPTLYAAAAGTVTLKIHAGDTVKSGDIVAEIESPDITDQYKREQSIYAQLEAEVARQDILAKKQKLLAQRDADQAEIERVAARLTFERIEAAGKLGVVPKNDFMRAEDAMRSSDIRARHAAQAALLENDDVALTLKNKQAQLQQQRLTLDFAKRRVDELKLRAPVNGLIGTVAVADRSVVPANTPLMTLVDLSRLEVELNIPETYVADLGLGMGVEIQTGDIKATGKLSALAPEVIKNEVLARVRFNDVQPAGLRQSQRVSGRLLIEDKPNVLILPRGPFLESEGGKFVYVLENGVAQRRPVKIGATSITGIEILEGLKVGDKVVIAGTESFDNAARITIND